MLSIVLRGARIDELTIRSKYVCPLKRHSKKTVVGPVNGNKKGEREWVVHLLLPKRVGDEGKEGSKHESGNSLNKESNYMSLSREWSRRRGILRREIFYFSTPQINNNGTPYGGAVAVGGNR